MFPQTQVANHFGPQHAANVRRGRDLAPRSDFFRDAAPPNNFATLQNKRGETFSCEVGRRGQPVMPAANNNGIKNFCLTSAHKNSEPEITSLTQSEALLQRARKLKQ